MQVKLPDSSPPNLPTTGARFDYLELLAATPDRGEMAAGERLTLDLIWRPAPSPYQDTYRGRFSLRNSQGEPVQSWTELLGGDAYPSAAWPTGYPVLDSHTLALADTLPPGTYELFIQVERAADGLPIPARQSWRPGTRDAISVGSIAIVDR